jgi:hypothetical protein
MHKHRFGSFWVGLYVWVISISFGMVLLDILYARRAPEAAAAFAEVADVLLLVTFAALLSAAAAIVFAWKAAAARNFLIASLGVILLELLLPAVVSPFVQNAQGLPVGPWIRILASGAASIFALIGWQRYYQPPFDRFLNPLTPEGSR